MPDDLEEYLMWDTSRTMRDVIRMVGIYRFMSGLDEDVYKDLEEYFNEQAAIFRLSQEA